MPPAVKLHQAIYSHDPQHYLSGFIQGFQCPGKVPPVGKLQQAIRVHPSSSQPMTSMIHNTYEAHTFSALLENECPITVEVKVQWFSAR